MLENTDISPFPSLLLSNQRSVSRQSSGNDLQNTQNAAMAHHPALGSSNNCCDGAWTKPGWVFPLLTCGHTCQEGNSKDRCSVGDGKAASLRHLRAELALLEKGSQHCCLCPGLAGVNPYSHQTTRGEPPQQAQGHQGIN